MRILRWLLIAFLLSPMLIGCALTTIATTGAQAMAGLVVVILGITPCIIALHMIVEGDHRD